LRMLSLSLSLSASLCLSLPLSASLCLSLPLPASPCLSLPLPDLSPSPELPGSPGHEVPSCPPPALNGSSWRANASNTGARPHRIHDANPQHASNIVRMIRRDKCATAHTYTVHAHIHHSGVHKGGLVKTGLAIHVLKASQIAKPPFTKPPFVNSRITTERHARDALRVARARAAAVCGWSCSSP